MILLKKRMIYSRSIVEAVDMRLGDQANKIVVADFVLRVQAQMISPLILVAGLVVAGRSHIGFTA